jgi:hypothetical protein
MTISEARHIARNYASGLGEALPGFKYGIGYEEDFFDKFYFDFIFLDVGGLDAKEPPFAGGARGITVDKKTSEVSVMSHGGYAALAHRQNELNQTYELFKGLKENRENLSLIKSKYNLTSKNLLSLLKVLEENSLSKEKIFEEIAQLIGSI